MSNADPNRTVGSAEEIDLRELFLALIAGKWIVALCAVLGCAIAVTYALLAPKVYESSIYLIPTEAPKSDQMGAAAALFGRKGGGLGDLDLYQTLLTSRKVMQKLLRTPVRNMNDTARGRIEPVSRTMGIDTTMPLSVMSAIEGLSKSMEVTTIGSGLGGILQVKVAAREPWLAQQLADAVVSIGQEELRRVRSERSTAVLGRIESASSSARAEWERAARQLADFRDRNPSLYLPAQQLELDRLVLERQVKEQKYLLARKEVEQQLLDGQKATPPALVLDSADLPARKRKPERTKITVIGTLAGILAGCMLAVGRRLFAAPA